MPPAKVADRASSNNGSDITTVDYALSGLTVGNRLIIRTAADNMGTGGAACTIALSNQSGTPINVGTVLQYQANNDPAGTRAGTTLNVLIAEITATSGTIRLTYSPATMQVAVVEEWSGVSAVVGTPVSATSASTSLASMTDSSVAADNLIYGALAIEAPNDDTYVNDSDTTGGAWIALTRVSTALITPDQNQTVWGAYKVPTVTGAQTYNATLGGVLPQARDSAGLLIEMSGAVNHVQTVTDSLGSVDAASVAATYARSLTDSLGLLDHRHVDFILTDALGLEDDLTGELHADAEPVGLADSVVVLHTGQIDRESTDALGLVDATTADATFERTATDALGLEDDVLGERFGDAESLGMVDSASTSTVATIDRSATDPLGLTDGSTRQFDASTTYTEPLGLVDSAVVAVTHTRTPAESLGVTDAATTVTTHTRTHTDALGLVDAVTYTRTLGPTLTDPSTLDDSVAGELHGDAERLGLVDSTSVAHTLGPGERTITDSLGLVDTPTDLAIDVSEDFTESIGLTDAKAAQLDRTLSESIGLVDASSHLYTADRTFVEPLGLTDPLDTPATTSREITDSLGLSDSAAPSLATREATDAIGLSDPRSVVTTSARSPVEALGLTDAVAIAATIGGLTDPLGLTDNASALTTSERTVTDALGMADAVAASPSNENLLTDPLGLVDSVEVTGTAERSVTDALGLTDPTTRAASSFSDQADALGVTDSIVVALSATVSVTDPLGLTDATAASVFTGARTVGDNLGLTDSVLTSFDRVRTVADALALADAVVFLPPGNAHAHAVTDALGLTDAPSAGLSSLPEWVPSPAPNPEPWVDITVSGGAWTPEEATVGGWT